MRGGLQPATWVIARVRMAAQDENPVAQAEPPDMTVRAGTGPVHKTAASLRRGRTYQEEGHQAAAGPLGEIMLEPFSRLVSSGAEHLNNSGRPGQFEFRDSNKCVLAATPIY